MQERCGGAGAGQEEDNVAGEAPGKEILRRATGGAGDG